MNKNSSPTAEELTGYLQSAFEEARKEPSFVERLGKVKMTIKVKTTEPDATLIMDLNKQEIWLGDANHPADATLSMSSATANQFWQGKVNMLAAITRGAVRVQGNLAAVMRVLPLAKQIFPSYIHALQGAGRKDLLTIN